MPRVILTAAACCTAALASATWADTTNVTWKNEVVIEKAGEFCSDDPNCFNRYHPDIPAVASAAAGDTRLPVDKDICSARHR